MWLARYHAIWLHQLHLWCWLLLLKLSNKLFFTTNVINGSFKLHVSDFFYKKVSENADSSVMHTFSCRIWSKDIKCQYSTGCAATANNNSISHSSLLTVFHLILNSIQSNDVRLNSKCTNLKARCKNWCKQLKIILPVEAMPVQFHQHSLWSFHQYIRHDTKREDDPVHRGSA